MAGSHTRGGYGTWAENRSWRTRRCRCGHGQLVHGGTYLNGSPCGMCASCPGYSTRMGDRLRTIVAEFLARVW